MGPRVVLADRQRDLGGLPTGAKGRGVRARRLGSFAPDETFARPTRTSSTAVAGESVALWVVPRGSILEVEDFVDELNKNYHRVDGYSLKAKLAEARERAGTSSIAIADDELVLGWRYSDWTGIAPVLEETSAFSSIAQNEIGHARSDLPAVVG